MHKSSLKLNRTFSKVCWNVTKKMQSGKLDTLNCIQESCSGCIIAHISAVFDLTNVLFLGQAEAWVFWNSSSVKINTDHPWSNWMAEQVLYGDMQMLLFFLWFWYWWSISPRGTSRMFNYTSSEGMGLFEKKPLWSACNGNRNHRDILYPGKFEVKKVSCLSDG